MISKLLLLFLMATFSLGASAQTVFVEKTPMQKEVRVFVTDQKERADLLVFKVNFSHESNPKKGLWYFSNIRHSNSYRIRFVNYPHQADLVVFYVPYRHLAGPQ